MIGGQCTYTNRINHVMKGKVMISKSELKELNEALKIRSLSATEWEKVDEYVSSKNEDYIRTEMAFEYPLLAMKYMPTKAAYEIFLQISCRMLNDSDKFIRKDYRARTVRKEHGDGSGLCLVIECRGMEIACVSALEDFLKSNSPNGDVFIGQFTSALAEALP